MSDSTKRNIKPATALAIGGILVAGAFAAIAIVRPGALDWILHPGDERSAQIKREMERQKSGEAAAKSDDGLKQAEKTRDAATASMPSPPAPSPPVSSLEETVTPKDGNTLEYRRIPKPGCISRDQVARVIGASEEAREGRVVGVNVTPDGRRLMVDYRKKTFLGIGSGENQIEGILRRGLRDRFSDRLIKSVKVRSAGTRLFRRGLRDVKVEVLEIESLQAGCRWP